ncbi:hypothetical protein D3C87_1699030 [compost metagenome]
MVDHGAGQHDLAHHAFFQADGVALHARLAHALADQVGVDDGLGGQRPQVAARQDVVDFGVGQVRHDRAAAR